MTILQAERLTGYGINCVRLPGRVSVSVSVGSLRVFSGKTLKVALGKLIAGVLDEHRLMALKRADWKCEECGSVAPLQVHHRTFRSHQGTHELSNLKAVCASCHQKAHGIRVA